MITKMGIVFPPKLLCYDQQSQKEKVKNFKGVRNLQWTIGKTPLKTTFKRLRSVTLENRNSAQKSNQTRLISNLLKQAKDIRVLSIKDDQVQSEVYQTLQRLKSLTSLEIKSKFMKDKDLLGIGRTLRLLPNIKTFSLIGVKSSTQEEVLQKAFGFFQEKTNLSTVHLGIQLEQNSQIIQRALSTVYALISTSPKISLHLISSFSGACSSEYIEETFKVLRTRKQLKGLRMESPFMRGNIASQEFVQFFETNPQLEVFSFNWKIGGEMSFDFLMGQDIMTPSEGLNKDNFAALTDSISACKNLKELSLDISLCSNLNDQCIPSLETAFAGLPNLKIFNLHFGCWWKETDSFSSASADSLSKMLPLLKELVYLDISFQGCKKLEDKPVQSLLQSISLLSNLRDLKLHFFRTSLTDEAFMDLAQLFEKLPEIRVFFFDVGSCNIQGKFFEPLTELIPQRLEKFKKCSWIYFNLSGTRVRLKSLLAEVKKYFPSYRPFIFVSGSIEVDLSVNKDF